MTKKTSNRSYKTLIREYGYIENDDDAITEDEFIKILSTIAVGTKRSCDAKNSRDKSEYVDLIIKYYGLAGHKTNTYKDLDTELGKPAGYSRASIAWIMGQVRFSGKMLSEKKAMRLADESKNTNRIHDKAFYQSELNRLSGLIGEKNAAAILSNPKPSHFSGK